MLRSVGPVDRLVEAWNMAADWHQAVALGMVGMVVIAWLWWMDRRCG